MGMSNAQRICSIEGCEKRAKSRGWCSMHYRRWRLTGDVGPAETLRIPRPVGQCSVPECDKLQRSPGVQYCEMHYARMYRTGSLEVRPVYTNQVCLAEGCERERTDIGMCYMHAARMRRHGHPDVVVDVADRAYRRGDRNPAWVGDQPSYRAAHQRVETARGRASDLDCFDCGRQAQHWSYDHNDSGELVTPEGHPYSANPDHYSPRCVSCHKLQDLARHAGSPQ